MSEDETTPRPPGSATGRAMGRTDDAKILQHPSVAHAGDRAADSRVEIYLHPGKIHEARDQAEQALRESRLPIFTREGQVVTVVGIDAPDAHIKPAKGIKRPKGAPQIVAVESAHLVHLLSSVAQFFKPRTVAGEVKWAPVDPPSRVADAILSNPEPNLRRLVGFLEAPIVTAAGQVPDRIGYLEDEQLLLVALPAQWHLHVPKAKPTQKAAQNAVRELRHAVETFPFVDDEDVAAALAMILSGIQRRVLPACPIFGIGAPTPGTGKSLLADVVSIICTGRPAAVMSIGDDGAELEKRLGAVLLAGDGFVAIDNVSQPLRSDLLCSVTTQPEIMVRVLGVSKRAKIATRTLITVTGNNLVFRGDLTRRVAPVRLDARTDRPEELEFNRDPRAFALQNRAALVSAALTIVKAYHWAGRPAVEGKPYGSFEVWDQMIRRPLIWAGLADPLSAVHGLRDKDPDREAHDAVLTAWFESFGEQPQTAAAVVREAQNRYVEGDQEAGRLTNQGLHDAIDLAVGRRGGQITSLGLGYWLRSHADRPTAGLVLRQVGTNPGKVALWAVEQVSTSVTGCRG